MHSLWQVMQKLKLRHTQGASSPNSMAHKCASVHMGRYKTHKGTCHKQDMCRTLDSKVTHLLREASWKLEIWLSSSLLLFGISRWWCTDFLPAAQPSRAARRNCMHLSAKWDASLLLPPNSDVLPLLQHSHCFTQLQREIWGWAAWRSTFSPFPPSLKMRCSRSAASHWDARSCFPLTLSLFLLSWSACYLTIFFSLFPNWFLWLSLSLSIDL